jgi:hypothetical protein
MSCLQWIALGDVGPFRLLLPYFALGIVAVYAALSGRRLKAALLYMRENAAWLTPVAVYVVMMTAILWGSAAENVSPRQIFYLVGGIALAASIATTRNIAAVFRTGGLLALVTLVVFIEFLARRIGLSWIDAIEEFFGRGNLKYLIYDFFTPIFNSIDQSTSDAFSASTKNEVANALLVVALLLRSGSAKPQRDLIGMACMAFALGLLVMLNDRSVLIAAAASLLIATALGAVAGSVGNMAVLAVKLAALLGVVVVGIAAMSTDSGMFGTLNQRFAFDDPSTAARLSQYHGALAMIEKHPFAGNGYFTIDGKYSIHDAFLSAWSYGGLIAFLLVVIFYLAVLISWARFVISVTRDHDKWVLPLAVEWVAALPFMPLFRMWLSGEGGILKFGEWMAISAFFGCLLANQLRLRAVARIGDQWRTRATVGGLVPSPAH